MRRASLALAVLGVAAVLASGCARPAPRPPVPASSEAPEFVATDAVVPTVTPVAVQPQPPSAEASVVIFYSPHPDDETLGMGQAIARYVRAGWQVYVALLTDGEDSRDYLYWYRKHPSWWRDLDGNGVPETRRTSGWSGGWSSSGPARPSACPPATCSSTTS